MLQKEGEVLLGVPLHILRGLLPGGRGLPSLQCWNTTILGFRNRKPQTENTLIRRGPTGVLQRSQGQSKILLEVNNEH